MIRNMDQLFPLESDSFLPLQSSGLGGLGVSWGANCFALEDYELERIGIPAAACRVLHARRRGGRNQRANRRCLSSADRQPGPRRDPAAAAARFQRRKPCCAAIRPSKNATKRPASTWGRACWPCSRETWATGGPTRRPIWISGATPAEAYTGRGTPSRSSKPSPNFTHLTGRLAQRFRSRTGWRHPRMPQPRNRRGRILLRPQTSAGRGRHQQRTSGAGVLSRLPVAPAHTVQSQPLGGGCKPFDARQTRPRPAA